MNIDETPPEREHMLSREELIKKNDALYAKLMDAQDHIMKLQRDLDVHKTAIRAAIKQRDQAFSGPQNPDEDAAELLKRALEEIRFLRRRAEVDGARLQVFDQMMRLFGAQPANQPMGFTEDVTWHMEKFVQNIEMRRAKGDYAGSLRPHVPFEDGEPDPNQTEMKLDQ